MGRLAQLTVALTLAATIAFSGAAAAQTAALNQVVGDPVDTVGDQLPAPPPAPVPTPPAPRVNTVSPPTAPTAPPAPPPPLGGTQPHGEGTVAAIDAAPGMPGALPGENDEEVVVGRSRGEQAEDGSYRGRVVLASLFGRELVAAETGPGQRSAGPLAAIQLAVLDALCRSASEQICLSVLAFESETTDTGTSNSFALARGEIGGSDGVALAAGESSGSIKESGGCQASHGSSRVAGARVGGVTSADVAASRTESRSCADGSRSQSGESSVASVGGSAVPVPASGCGSGQPNTETSIIPQLLNVTCNATDENGAQAAAPYGVRDALSVATRRGPLVTLTAGSSESRAAAPTAPASTPAPGQGGVKALGQSDGRDARRGAEPGTGPGGGRPASSSAASSPAPAPSGATTVGGDELPFTGLSIFLVAAIGAIALGVGLALRAAGRSRAPRRAAAAGWSLGVAVLTATALSWPSPAADVGADRAATRGAGPVTTGTAVGIRLAPKPGRIVDAESARLARVRGWSGGGGADGAIRLRSRDRTALLAVAPLGGHGLALEDALGALRTERGDVRVIRTERLRIASRSARAALIETRSAAGVPLRAVVAKTGSGHVVTVATSRGAAPARLVEAQSMLRTLHLDS